MNRIASCLSTLAQRGRKALIPFITAGDPRPASTPTLMHALVAGGADIIELGMPFSDPMADGPVIQKACERALRAGTTVRKVLDMVVVFRRKDQETPVVLMGYLNPVLRFGIDAFAREAKASGVDGVLLVDLPAEEAQPYIPALAAQGLDSIFLLSPTSTARRIRAAAKLASGYLYYVSLKGVTGAGSLDLPSVRRGVRDIRRLSGLPVAVGFGVKDAATAQAIGRIADAVVVGSALVQEIAVHKGAVAPLARRLQARARQLRRALDALG